MNFRPWLVGMGLLASLIFNVALLFFENVEPPVTKEQGDVEKLKNILVNTATFAPNNRLTNFKEMYGLPPELARDANKKAEKLLKERGDIYEKLLKDKAEDATGVLCKKGEESPDKPAQIYHAAQVVMIRGDDGAATILTAEFTDFVKQDWFQSSQIGDVYKKLEVTTKRNPDATFMGIAAVLVGAEGEKAVMDEIQPWGTGFSWSPDNMLEKYQDKSVRQKLVDYFAMSAILLELAHKENGICRV